MRRKDLDKLKQLRPSVEEHHGLMFANTENPRSFDIYSTNEILMEGLEEVAKKSSRGESWGGPIRIIPQWVKNGYQVGLVIEPESCYSSQEIKLYVRKLNDDGRKMYWVHFRSMTLDEVSIAMLPTIVDYVLNHGGAELVMKYYEMEQALKGKKKVPVT